MNNYVRLLILKLLNQVTHFEETKKRKILLARDRTCITRIGMQRMQSMHFMQCVCFSLGASTNAAKVSTGSEVGLTNMPCEILPGDERLLGRRQVRALGRAANN